MLIVSGQALRGHGDGPAPRQHNSAQIPSHDALRSDQSESETLLASIANSQQTVRIVSLDHPSGLIRTGDRSKVVFEFVSHTEYVKEGQLILLREAKTKVLGVVTKVL